MHVAGDKDNIVDDVEARKQSHHSLHANSLNSVPGYVSEQTRLRAASLLIRLFSFERRLFSLNKRFFFSFKRRLR